MTVAVVSIVLLVALFAATVIRGFDLGLAALSAAFFLGLAAGVPVEEITGFFPADFFVLIVGVTALFAAAQLTGTLDWILDLLLRLVGGRIALVALVPFVIGAVLTAIGTLPAAATAIVAPIALGLAARYRIMPLVAAILGITGIIAGLLSPLAVYGITARELSQKLGIDLPGTAAPLFLLGGIVAGLAVSGVCLLIGLRTGAVPRGRITDDDDVPLGGPNPTERRSGVTTTAPATTTARVLTVGSLVAVVVLSVGFDLNVGYLGLTAALFLQVTLRITPGEIIGKVPWNVVVLIGGLLTYVGLMQHLGAFERISELLRVQGSASLSLLVLCYIAGVTSFAASSIAVFVTTMPLLPAVVDAGVSPVGGVLALALASILVDLNPLGIAGGLILGAAEESARPRLFRHLLTYGLISVVIAPFVAWLAFGWW